MERIENLRIDGEQGLIDCVVDWPEGEVKGWALVLHPHPLHGGTRDNKVVTTIARSCTNAGLVVVRPNFRGVGESEGEFDHGTGETTDMLAVVAAFQAQYPNLRNGQWALAGFSFGTAVAAQLYSTLAEQGHPLPTKLLLAGPAVRRFSARDVVLPEHTFLVHGEEDEVVPVDEAMELARAYALPLTLIPDATHFFHGKLLLLRNLISQQLR